MTNLQDEEQRNMVAVRRLMEDGYGRGDLSILPDVVAPNFVGYLAIGEHYGPDGIRIDITSYRSRLSNLIVTIDDMGAFGDRVAYRFTMRGCPRSSSCGGADPVELRGIAISRCVARLLVETWICVDALPFG